MGRASVFTYRLARVRGTGIGGIAAPGHTHHHVLDQLLGVERLTGGKCRAHRFAATALHAGIEAQQLVPGKVGRLFHAQRRRFILKVERFEAR